MIRQCEQIREHGAGQTTRFVRGCAFALDCCTVSQGA